MTAVDRTLARMHARVRFSAPSYLGSATPATVRGEEAFRDWLDRVRRSYERLEAAFAESLRDRRAPIDTGTFPMRFAAWHDLSPKYLTDRLRREVDADRDALIALRNTLPEFEPETRYIDEFATLLTEYVREANALLTGEAAP